MLKKTEGLEMGVKKMKSSILTSLEEGMNRCDGIFIWMTTVIKAMAYDHFLSTMYLTKASLIFSRSSLVTVL